MINVLPINDLAPHTPNNTCKCHPWITFEQGEMIVVHNLFSDSYLNLINIDFIAKN